jgi:hypothetical protein
MAPNIYRHYKGQFYRVLFQGKHAETLEEVVGYEALYQNSVSQYWVRPLKDFESMVEINGKPQPRFRIATAAELKLITLP